MSSFPYIQFSNVFNPNDFLTDESPLTISAADSRYVQIGSFGLLSALTVSGITTSGSIDLVPTNRTFGGVPFTNVLWASNTSRYFCTRQPTADTFVMLSYAAGGVQTDAITWAAIGTTLSVTGSVNISSNLVMGANTISAAEIGVLDGVVGGTAAASKALVLNSSSNITGINSLSATSLTGTLITAAQPNITSLGSQTSILDLVQSTNATGASPINSYGLSLRRFTITNGDNCGLSFAVTNSPLSALPGGSLTFTRSGSNSYGYFSFNTQPTAGASLTETMRIDPTLVTINQNLTVDPSKSISGFLSTPNQSAITSVGLLDHIATGTSDANDAYLNIKGSTLGYTNGAFCQAITLTGANATPARGQILISNNTAGTSTNAMWIGTSTANDLILGTNGSTKMLITSAGRVGIGISTPATMLDVLGSVSVSIDIGGSGYASYPNTGIPSTGLGPVSIATSIKASNAIWTLSAFYSSSDRRLKEYIQPVHEEDCEKFLDVEPVYFNLKNDSTVQIGYIAQDIAACGLQSLISFLPREGLDIEDSRWDLQDVQLGIDYSRVSAVLHVLIKKQDREIKKQARQIDKLQADMAAVFRMLAKED